jgi:glycosyltransferase involved in cell wall biosynthesis
MDPLGNKIGGIETMIRSFIKYAPDDFDIEFVGVTSDKQNRPVGKWQQITAYTKKINFLPVLYIREENVRTTIPLSLKFTLSLFKYKKQLNCKDRILTYHRIEPSFPHANIPAKKVCFIHNNTIDLLYSPHTEVKWRNFPLLYFQMEKKLISQMNKVFAVREDVVESYQKKYPFMADRFSFLPTWVDEETFSPYNNEVKAGHKSMFLKSKSLQANTKLILFVARLEGQKDPLLLIDTFYYVNKHFPEIILLIVGTGALKGKMEDKIKQYGLKEKICFLSTLSQKKVAELMRISDVFLLTSAFEGMPRSVLEALGCGLPVVSTDVGEVRRVVRNKFSGLICTERKATAIGDAVLKVLNGKNISVDKCLLSIQDYTAKRVLGMVYSAYYDLTEKR